MASEIDIVNLALSRLGDSATVASIDPPEGSAQSEHCARFYPIARDVLLEMHPWKFATRRASLTPLSVETWNWSFAYGEPNNLLRILSILPPSANRDEASELFDAFGNPDGQPVIFTDVENATAVYVERVTDTGRFSPLFVDALGWLLASHLAGPIIKGDAGISMGKSCYQSFAALLAQAKVSDANQRRVIPAHSPTWMAGR